jgi:hypothetical protein
VDEQSDLEKTILSNPAAMAAVEAAKTLPRSAYRPRPRRI